MNETWRRTTVWLVAVTAAVSLAGCASTRPIGERQGPPAAVGDCFNANTATSFDYLQNRYVYVTTTGRRHFLLTLANECIALQSAMGIAVHSRFQRVCSDSEASITFLSFNHPHYCRIIRVEEVRDRAAAEALVAARTSRREGGT
jgi:hypothetical protein